MSLGYLSEMVKPRVTVTVSINCCRHSVRLICFIGELGSTSHLILIDETVLGKLKGSAQTDYYGWRFFFFKCRPTEALTYILRTMLDPVSFCYSPPSLSLTCQSELGRGSGSNQPSLLGVSGSSWYKQPEVVPVTNTILTPMACLASMIIRAISLLICLL